jgi:ABC-2 type transport system permease protein
LNAAVEFELLKGRRSNVFRWGALVMVIGVPALSTGFFQLARIGGDTPAAGKAAAMVTDFDLTGLLGMAGQVLTVAMLLTAGIATSWSFGREFVDDAIPALFAIATPRSTVAAAKFIVLGGWALATVTLTMVLTVACGLLVGLQLHRPAGTMAAQALTAGVLSAARAAQLVLVSSWRRGYLPGSSRWSPSSWPPRSSPHSAAEPGSRTPHPPSGWAWGPRCGPRGDGRPALIPLVVVALAALGTTSWWRHAEAS